MGAAGRILLIKASPDRVIYQTLASTAVTAPLGIGP